MKKIYFVVLLLLLLLLFAGCSGSGDSPAYVPSAKKWTVYGDSTGKQFGDRWIALYGNREPLDNYAVNGSIIEQILKDPDPYARNRVILMVGGNNLQLGHSPASIANKYAHVLLTLKAKRVYCVGLNPVAVADYDAAIWELNEYIRAMCPDTYIDAWALFESFDESLSDGLHHSLSFDKRIMHAILEADMSYGD